MVKQVYSQQLVTTLGAAKAVADDLSMRILTELSLRTLRYSELRLGVSSKTLAARLKLLQRHGLVTRTLHAEVPPRVEYAITEKGAELLSILQGLAQWEQSWQKV